MYKNVLLLLSLCGALTICRAQNPVKWTFSATKIADKTYEVKFKAVVRSPWHIYSQYSPEGGALPTKITFNKNPVATPSGKTKEMGNMKEKYEEVFDVTVKYFQGNAEFVQLVKLKAATKTNISGKIEFMACNDEQCLPGESVSFKIDLN